MELASQEYRVPFWAKTNTIKKNEKYRGPKESVFRKMTNPMIVIGIG
jgi:hypothetical protein